MWSALDDLERDMPLHLIVLGEPDGGEVAPAELPDDEIAAVGEGVADMHGVVAAFAVVFEVLLVFGHDRTHVGRCVHGGRA